LECHFFRHHHHHYPLIIGIIRGIKAIVKAIIAVRRKRWRGGNRVFEGNVHDDDEDEYDDEEEEEEEERKIKTVN